MHIITQAQQRIQQFAGENSTTLLTAGGVVGTVATGVVSFRAGGKYKEISLNIEMANARLPNPANGETEIVDAESTTLDKVRASFPHLVPPAIVMAATITSIIMANRMSAQKAAALAAAYGLTQSQFEEYKNKVAEKLGVQKTQKLQDELAQEQVNKTPGYDKLVIIEGDDVLCFDMPTGRYFKSSMEKINKAVNAVNNEILRHDHASATTFYDELELPPTTWSDDVGWNSGRLVELAFTTVLDPDNKPCLAIDFKNLPLADYQRNLY